MPSMAVPYRLHDQGLALKYILTIRPTQNRLNTPTIGGCISVSLAPGFVLRGHPLDAIIFLDGVVCTIRYLDDCKPSMLAVGGFA